MTIIQQRELLKGVYNSAKWTRKVDAMPDDQVLAIFLRLQQQGRIKI